MRELFLTLLLGVAFTAQPTTFADPALLKTHCSNCHNDEKAKGKFNLRFLEDGPNDKNAELWMTSLDYVKAGEMPPEDESKLSAVARQRLVAFLTEKVYGYSELTRGPKRAEPRRLNNRELANSVRDVLMIEDVGTHHPIANLLGDTLKAGFDTDGDSLGLSQYHLEQYIAAFRKIVDATILSGERPETRRVVVRSDDLRMTSRSQRKRPEQANRTPESIDFLDIRLRAYFSNLETTPASGRYRIKIRATGVDRGVYDSAATGVYKDDPIRLRVHLGGRVRDFDLPDEEVMEIELDEWIAAGTKLQMSYPTDGLRQRGNGNFKFQYAIAHDHLKKNDPELYAKIVSAIAPNRPGRTAKQPRHWSHWTYYWQGPRPRLFNAEVEGPIYDSWPPKRQIALLGRNPKAENAAEILRPIAERAWRHNFRDGELDSISRLVQSRVEQLGDIEALKEGIVAILVSPSFLLINPEEGKSADRFATKLSYFLKSTTPDTRIRQTARNGKLRDFKAVLTEVHRQFDQGEAGEFLREFPHAWLQLDRINFMAPDPDKFPLYDRKRISEDMVNEALYFFRHAIDNNLPLPEFLSAEYSFINADLAKIYGVHNVHEDSKLRKYTFTDGRRGGLLGMGAFLTLTADSLGTSPIHRAIYVMENYLGIHPAPPPADVEITEPDIRQAKTIKEILNAHRSDPNCASCHQSIDPYGYAFENFDPMGAWRDHYTMQIAPKPSRAELLKIQREDQERTARGLAPIPKPWENKPISIDASARFRNGAEYRNIVDFRKHMLTDANRDRFVRCFITKLLTYDNGAEPDNYSEVDKILSKSAENDYRIIDTIAAVADSSLFREE